jgi:hypothetical protein
MPLAPLLAAVSLAVQPSDGALTLALDGKPVITGVLAEYPLKISGTTVRQDSPRHYTVDVSYTDHSTADYSYALAGSDCMLTYTLTNHGAKGLAIDLSGLNCTFAPGARLTGTISHWHWTYYQNTAVWHPGLQSPLGAVYAADGHQAAVFYSPSEADRQSLINASWKLGFDIPNPFGLEFHTREVVAPGASGSASLVMHLTEDLSPEGLYGAYKTFLTGRYPATRPLPDRRPMGMFSSVDQSLVTPANPHGYNGDMRRFDLPSGVDLFLRKVADPLRAGGAQGCIFWAPGGAEPVMYPPDFDDNLARIADTWPALVEGFRARKLRVGLCARAAEWVDRTQPEHPLVRRIDPADPRQVETLLGRFRRVAGMGVNAYYLDTFGNDWASTQLLAAIRQTVGPDVPIYTEYCTDATLPYADRYCEYSGGDGVAWTSPEQLEAFRYLFPRSVWLCLSRTPQPVPPDFARLGLTPLIQDYLVSSVLAGSPVELGKRIPSGR